VLHNIAVIPKPFPHCYKLLIIHYLLLFFSHSIDALLLCLYFTQISDIRERLYEKMGIGSSYLFRLDDGYVVSRSMLCLLHFLLPNFKFIILFKAAF
jgi:hypothetical protein